MRGGDRPGDPGSETRRQCVATLSRISSAVLVRMKGRGWSFQSATGPGRRVRALGRSGGGVLELLLCALGEPTFHLLTAGVA